MPAWAWYLLGVVTFPIWVCVLAGVGLSLGVIRAALHWKVTESHSSGVVTETVEVYREWTVRR